MITRNTFDYAQFGLICARISFFMDAVFGYCIENDLFKQPLDIKLVD